MDKRNKCYVLGYSRLDEVKNTFWTVNLKWGASVHSLGKKGTSSRYTIMSGSFSFVQKPTPHCAINIYKYCEPIRAKKTQCVEPQELLITVSSN